MIITNKGVIVRCYKKHTISKSAFLEWISEAENAHWKSFSDIKRRYNSADPIKGDRAVINIKGNSYRLVIKVNYEFEIVNIRFAETHAEYNKINAETI